VCGKTIVQQISQLADFAKAKVTGFLFGEILTWKIY